MTRPNSSHRRVAISVVGLLAAAVLVPMLVLAAPAGKPGNFRLTSTSPEALSGDRAEAIVAAKLDDQPGTDLAVVNAFSGFALLSGDGDGGFTEVDSLTFPDPPIDKNVTGIAVADLDGVDGTDLAVSLANGPTMMAILLNDGTGGFTQPASSPEPVDGVGVASGDVNGDGDIDLVTGGGTSGTVLFNDGSGDFTPGDSFALPASERFEIKDLDDDGHRDVVAVDQQADAPLVSFNDGDGNFSDGLAVGDGGDSEAVGLAVGTIGRGSSPDIAVGFESESAEQGGIEVFLNDGDGNFSPSPRSPLGLGRRFNDVHIGDADGDRRGDVLGGEGTAGGSKVAVFLSKRRGRFKEPDTSPESLASGDSSPWLSVGQFDARPYKDVAAAGGDAGALSILLNRSP